MAWTQGISLAFAFLQAISFVFTSIVAWKIYSKQKMDSDDQLKRDVRLRLTQAYYNLDNEALRSRDNMEMARELLQNIPHIRLSG